MEEPSPHDLEAMAFTERQLFSLYVQYPEINFDPESTRMEPESSDHFSSPASNTVDRDELASVQESNSTRNTTPLKHDMFRTETAEEDEYAMYCKHLARCDLPSQTVEYLSKIGSSIIPLGRCVLAGDLPSDTESDIDNVLLPQLRRSTHKIQEQIDTIDYVTELTPFNVVPTDVSLWSTYRQRTSLISKSDFPPVLCVT